MQWTMTGSTSGSSVLCGGATEIPRAHTQTLFNFMCSRFTCSPCAAEPTGTVRDHFGTPFGPGFLSPSCPAIATTPAPSVPSENPRPACFFFFRAHPSSPLPRLPLHQMHQSATLSKSVSEPNPRSALHLRPSAPPNCCTRASPVPVAQMRNEPTICVQPRSSAVPTVLLRIYKTNPNTALRSMSDDIDIGFRTQ
jgi:hypothetical protein